MTDLLEIVCACGHPEETHLPPWEGTAFCPACQRDCLAQPSPLERVRSWAIRRRLSLSRRAGVGTKLLTLLVLIFLLWIAWVAFVAWLHSASWGLLP